MLSVKQNLTSGQRLCFVAKANCYGLGDKQVCLFIEDLADYFAVSSVSEFLRLKKHISKPILILDPIYENILNCIKLGAELTIANLESFDAIKHIACINKKYIFKIHIAVNTGMNRFGFNNEKEIKQVLKEISNCKNIVLIGVFSHLAASGNKKFSLKQINQFENFKKIIQENYIKNKVIFHICASNAITKYKNFDMVRLGIGAYNDDMIDIFSLKTNIVAFQNLKKDEFAGYNFAFKAKKYTKIAIVSVGYGDGIFRCLNKKGNCLVNGKFCRIVAVCMDSILIDVSKVECKLCDEVVLVGKNGNNRISSCKFASWCDTISYEILTHLTKRVERKYIEG